MGDGVKRRILVYGEKIMHVEVRFEEGAVGATYTHPYTQTTKEKTGDFDETLFCTT